MARGLEPIKAEATHFTAFLSSEVVEVPALQRTFRWEEEQTRDFIRDLSQITDHLKLDPNNRTQHLLGTIVLVSQDTPGAASQVVDGQQRLTVVTLTLGLVRQEMLRLREQVAQAGGPQHGEITNQLDMEINDIGSKLWKPVFGKPPLLVFTPAPEIEKTFTDLISGGSGNVEDEQRDPAKRLREIAEILRDDFIRHPEFYVGQESVEKMRHLGRLKTAILDRLLFVSVITSGGDTGYELFEVLNARGEELEPIDLVKTWIMARLVGHLNKAEVAEIESKIRRIASDDKKKEHKYLETYFKARRAETLGKKHAKENSRRVRKLIFRDPVLNKESGLDGQELRSHIIDEVRQMSAWYSVFERIRTSTWPYPTNDPFGASRMLHLNRTLKHDLHFPLLLTASQHVDAMTFLSMVHAIEKTFFRFKTICNGSPSKLDAVYDRHTWRIDSTKNIDLAEFKSDLQALLDVDAGDETFAVLLSQNFRYNLSPTPVLRYFFQLLDMYESRPSPAKLAIYDAIHIEHIGPQNPRDGEREVGASEIHRIGNLCILTAKENRDLKNFKFASKKKIVDSWKVDTENPSEIYSPLSRKVFTDNDSWNTDLVIKREEVLIAKAILAFRADSGEI